MIKRSNRGDSIADSVRVAIMGAFAQREGGWLEPMSGIVNVISRMARWRCRTAYE